MKWVNARKKLPEEGQLIWCLQIENRQGDRSGLPAANMYIAQACKDRYGVMYAQEISHKGYTAYDKHFYEWWHWDQSEKEPGRDQIYNHFSSDCMIDAWMPFEDLPDWVCINVDESIEIITKLDSYKEGVEYDKTKRVIDEAVDSPYFILLGDKRPVEDGIYVVANKDGIWLSRYETKLKGKWLAPNGKEVEAWYPIPSHYPYNYK